MHPAARLISQGRAALTHPASARASRPPSGSTSPEAAPAAKARHLDLPSCASGRLTAAPSGMFCSPMPSARASAPLMASGSPRRASAAARPTTMPSGRLCRVTASTIRPLRPGPAFSRRPASVSSRKSPTAPSSRPTAGGTHAGSGPCSARSMAGKSRLHTLAASMMPAAMPQSIRRVAGSPVFRSRNTPAAPAVVQSIGSSSTAAVRKICSKSHSPFSRSMPERQEVCRERP